MTSLVIASVHYFNHACMHVKLMIFQDKLFAKFVLNWTTCDVPESWGWLVLQDQWVPLTWDVLVCSIIMYLQCILCSSYK